MSNTTNNTATLPQLVPGQPNGTPVFKTREERDQWRRSFHESIKPELERLARARDASNEFAKTRYVA